MVEYNTHFSNYFLFAPSPCWMSSCAPEFCALNFATFSTLCVHPLLRAISSLTYIMSPHLHAVYHTLETWKVTSFNTKFDLIYLRSVTSSSLKISNPQSIAVLKSSPICTGVTSSVGREGRGEKLKKMFSIIFQMFFSCFRH